MSLRLWMLLLSHLRRLHGKYNLEENTLLSLLSTAPQAVREWGSANSRMNSSLESYVPHQRNPLLLGDFNIHVSDLDDGEAMDFLSTMSIMGYDQHVNFCTHHQGNMLDLAFAPHLTQITVLRVTQGPFFSDHCAVLLTLGIVKSNFDRKVIKYRKIKGIDSMSFGRTLQGMLSAVNQNQSAEKLAGDFQLLATTLLDVHAPERQSLQTVHPHRPWFNKEIKTQETD